MINIIYPEFNEKYNCDTIFIFNKIKINILTNKEFYKDFNTIKGDIIFMGATFFYPINNFLEQLKIIIADTTIKFCYLSECKTIFYVKKNNIKIINNIIDIKKSSLMYPIFEKDGNKIDHIIPPDTSLDYINLLKIYELGYDNIINKDNSYKAFEKFLKLIVCEKSCYNIILFIKNISELNFIKNFNYKLCRFTIFHNLKDEEETLLLGAFCKKYNILFYVYMNYNISFFFNINNLRSIWFEKIVLINDITKLDINELNKYHSVKANILFDNIISISSSDFICINLFISITRNNFKFSASKIFDLIKNYVYNNFKENTYIKNKEYMKKQNMFPFKLKVSHNLVQNQLLLTRNYPKIIENIDNEIKENYDEKKIVQLLVKKTSISILCKPETEMLIDIDKIISCINDLSYLTNLVFLFSNIKNTQIMNKLYIKILKLSNENKCTELTIKCFQKLLALNMDEASLDAVFDFILLCKANNTIPGENLKKIVDPLFISMGKYVTNDKIMDKFNKVINDIFNITDILEIDKILSIQVGDNKVFMLHFLIFLTTNFNSFYTTNDAFIKKREEIKNNLLLLLEKDLPTCNLESVPVIPICNFYLSYQGVSSCDIFILKSKLIRKICPELSNTFDSNFINEKINICFHTNFFTRWHSVFKDRHQIVKALSYDVRFNVYFSTYDDLSEETKYCFGNATHVKLTGTLTAIKNKLTELKLDVLVYCEIGMDPKAYFMALMKMSKFTINTWGHSDTSGIDTIDYFFSSKLYELPLKKAQTHYSEKLILLNSLCTYYINPMSKYNVSTFKNRYDLGFSDEVIIFSCCQSLFKISPSFDDYIVQILSTVPNSVLLMLNGENKINIIKRLNGKNISDKMHFFPMMAHNQYLNFIHSSDIILDTYPFGSCNSSLEAFSLGKVVITQQSEMINGRFTSGFYKKMNINDNLLICKTKQQYIASAIKFATDKQHRSKYEEEIKSKSNLLFCDKESINEWRDNIINICNKTIDVNSNIKKKKIITKNN